MAKREKKLVARVEKLASAKKEPSVKPMFQSFAVFWAQKPLFQTKRQVKLVSRVQRKLAFPVVRKATSRRPVKWAKAWAKLCVLKKAKKVQRKAKLVPKKRKVVRVRSSARV